MRLGQRVAQQPLQRHPRGGQRRTDDCQQHTRQPRLEEDHAVGVVGDSRLQGAGKIDVHATDQRRQHDGDQQQAQQHRIHDDEAPPRQIRRSHGVTPPRRSRQEGNFGQLNCRAVSITRQATETASHPDSTPERRGERCRGRHQRTAAGPEQHGHDEQGRPSALRRRAAVLERPPQTRLSHIREGDNEGTTAHRATAGNSTTGHRSPRCRRTLTVNTFASTTSSKASAP